MFVAVREADGGNVAMYSGLAVAVLVFIMVLIIIICLLRRRLPLFVGQLRRLTYLLYSTLASHGRLVDVVLLPDVHELVMTSSCMECVKRRCLLVCVTVIKCRTVYTGEMAHPLICQ